jgi:hypothetical protein
MEIVAAGHTHAQLPKARLPSERFRPQPHVLIHQNPGHSRTILQRPSEPIACAKDLNRRRCRLPLGNLVVVIAFQQKARKGVSSGSKGNLETIAQRQVQDSRVPRDDIGNPVGFDGEGRLLRAELNGLRGLGRGERSDTEGKGGHKSDDDMSRHTETLLRQTVFGGTGMVACRIQQPGGCTRERAIHYGTHGSSRCSYALVAG